MDLARDRVLVTRAQGGDRTAFDDLYMRYYRRLYRFCLRRLHDAHEAEDVAQEAFARAWRALPSFGGDRRFYPWLSVIASHLCTDVLRRRNRSTPVAEFHQTNVASTEDGAEELMVAAVDSDLVAKAFTRLSDRHQRILHLREGSGWSYQRIADHEGVGITAVETLLWRARQALKREFATLAGAEGRMGAWIGAALSAASLRRFLRLPSRMLRKFATTGAKGAVVAAGSAAVTAAMVIGAMNSPSTPTTISESHGAPGASGPFSHGLMTPAAAKTLLPLSTTTGSGSSGSSNGTVDDLAGGSSGSGLSGSSTNGISGGSDQNPIAQALQDPGGTLDNVGDTVDTAVNDTVSGALSTTESVARQAVSAVDQTVTALLGGTTTGTSATGSLVDGSGSSGSSSSGSSSPSSSSDSSSSTNGTVSGTLSKVSDTVNDVLGGL